MWKIKMWYTVYKNEMKFLKVHLLSLRFPLAHASVFKDKKTKRGKGAEMTLKHNKLRSGTAVMRSAR